MTQLGIKAIKQQSEVLDCWVLYGTAEFHMNAEKIGQERF